MNRVIPIFALVAIFTLLPALAQLDKANVSPIAKTLAAKSEAPKAPPVISPDLQARFFKAQAWMLSAQSAAEHAQQELKTKQDGFTAVIQEVQKACGDDFTAGLNQGGDPVCQPKASAPKEPSPPVKK